VHVSHGKFPIAPVNGQQVGLGIVHECSQLRPSGAKLVGDMPPGLHGVIVIGLHEGLSDRGPDHGVLAASVDISELGKRWNAEKRANVFMSGCST
jgi:hypothetical protein